MMRFPSWCEGYTRKREDHCEQLGKELGGEFSADYPKIVNSWTQVGDIYRAIFSKNFLIEYPSSLLLVSDARDTLCLKGGNNSNEAHNAVRDKKGWDQWRNKSEG